MTGDLNLGPINGHLVGRALKEAMRRAAVRIQSERAKFDAMPKQGYGGNMDDVFTSADTAAQDVYMRTFSECFPDCGVIGEENKLRIEPKNGCSAYLTVDPLDGTKAFVRRQSHGIGTMVALVDCMDSPKEVLSAYIGDVNTDEVYGYRPGSDDVYRITRLDSFEKLGRDKPIALKNSFALLRENPGKYHQKTCELLFSSFKDYEVMGSSIGTWFARQWKNEVAALFLPPGFETPWDSTPVVGIAKKLGYVFLGFDLEVGWVRYEPKICTETYYRAHDTVIVHQHDLAQLGIQ